MSALSHILQRAAAHPEALSAEDFATLRRIDAQAPASTVAAALLLRYDASLPDDERRRLQQRVALLQGDARATINFIDPSGAAFADFYPPMEEPARPSTDSAIDTFLATYGHQSPEEDALLERMIFNPVPDYAEQLARTVWSSGTLFYRENNDDCTRLFVHYMPRGSYHFQYTMTVTTAGTFASGLATIQSQLAPAVTAHSAASTIIAK